MPFALKRETIAPSSNRCANRTLPSTTKPAPISRSNASQERGRRFKNRRPQCLTLPCPPKSAYVGQAWGRESVTNILQTSIRCGPPSPRSLRPRFPDRFSFGLACLAAVLASTHSFAEGATPTRTRSSPWPVRRLTDTRTALVQTPCSTHHPA